MRQRFRQHGGFALAVVLPPIIFILGALFAKDRVLGWERAQTVSVDQIAPLAIGLAAYGVLIQVMLAQGRRPGFGYGKRAALALGLIFVSGVGLQLAATRVVEPYPVRAILSRQFSQFSGGYFTVGARIEDMGAFLANFVQNMPTFPIHPAYNPPALAMLFWMGRKVAEATPGLTAWFAPAVRPLACFDEYPTPLTDAQIVGGMYISILEVVLANAVIVPLFLFVRRIANARAALLAAALYPTTACMLMWAGRFNRIYPLIAVLSLWLCEEIVRAPAGTGPGAVPPRPSSAVRTGLLSFALGVLLASGLFFTIANLPILTIPGVYFLARAWQMDGRVLWRKHLGHFALMAAGFILFWGVWLGPFGYDLIGTYRISMAQHLSLDRPYWPWALYAGLDLFDFIGLPISAIALLFVWRRYGALSLSFALPIFVLSVTRLAHDETGRLLGYFAPVAVALAAIYLDEHSLRVRVGVIALTFAQILVHVALLRVISYGVDPLTVPTPQLPADLIRTDIRYEPNGDMRLLGYTINQTVQPAGTGQATFYWQLDSQQPITTSYRVFVHIARTLDDDGRIVNLDGKPMNWALPTTCWQPGQVVMDSHEFQVDPKAQPGDYVVLLGLSDEVKRQRAFVHTAQVAKANAVELPTVVHVGTR